MELHPFGCSMVAAFIVQVVAAIWALVIASRIRPRSSQAAALLAAAAITELVWRALYCARQIGSAAIYEADLTILLDVIAVVDILERGVVMVLAALAVRALVADSTAATAHRDADD